jgi:quercetin dioxygenase-like cupin family protein
MFGSWSLIDIFSASKKNDLELDHNSRIPLMRELLDTGAEMPHGQVQFGEGGGDAVSLGLLKNEHTAVAYTFIPPEKTFDTHRHEQREYLIVVTGMITINDPDGLRGSRLLVGDYVVFDPNVPHGVTAGPEGADLIVVTIPPDEGFPDARE